jgi:Fur family peroxide stress response transcriptional regulator
MQAVHSQMLQQKIKEFERECRLKGHRLTHQRLEIFRELASTTEHPSAEDIYNGVHVRMPTISLDTVYRTLLSLEHFGLVKRVHAFDDRARFDANLTPHQHLVCTTCKRITDFIWEDFEDLLPPPETKKWGVIEAKNVVFEGTCKECMEK